MSDKERNNFGKNLKIQRIKAGLTQKELAEQLNISRSCLANYESFQRFPDDEMISLVANCFGVNRKELLREANISTVGMQIANTDFGDNDEGVSAVLLDISKCVKKGKIVYIKL